MFPQVKNTEVKTKTSKLIFVLGDESIQTYYNLHKMKLFSNRTGFQSNTKCFRSMVNAATNSLRINLPHSCGTP